MATEAVGSNCAAIPMSGKQALPVLAQGERWVVIAKPSGMVLHPSHYAGQFRDTVVQVAAAQFGRPVHAVHRLDAATSGTLLLAFDAETVAALARQFLERKVEKRYLAVVRGWPAPEAGRIEHALEDEKGRRQEATSHYRVLALAEFPWPTQRFPQARYALVEVRPEHGRRHQIRRHLKHLSHPLIGDSRYGKGEHNRLFRMHLSSHRLLLHAAGLVFDAPEGPRQRVDCPLTTDLVRVLSRPEWVPLVPAHWLPQP